MASPVQCPHCEQTTDFEQAEPGGVADCPACDQSFLLPASGESGAPESKTVGLGSGEPLRLPNREAADDTHSRDVRLSTTGLLAGGLTLAFYFGLVIPLGDSYFGQLFGARGWVPYAISYLAIWCGVLLAAKYLRLRRRVGVLELDLLPHQLSDQINPDNVQGFIDYLSRLPGPFSQDFLFQRIRRALDHFHARANVAETVDQLRLDAERDENIVDSGYTMLRVFIWAIPILGFIGTVLGIGASVGGFSESVSSASNLDVMKDAIGVVTSGLGVAFDTTLLALVMSIFIMVPTSSLQKTEEDYLGQVDDYCQRHLVSRLGDGASGRHSGRDEAWLDAAADRLAERVLVALDQRLSGTD